MKKKIIISLLSIISLFYIPSQNAFASIINKTNSYDGIDTYYVSSDKENQLVFNIVLAKHEDEFNIIYSGDMAKVNPLTYLNYAVGYNDMYQDNVYGVDYGIGSYYSYSSGYETLRNNTILAKYNVVYVQNSDKINYIYDKVNSDIKKDMSKLITDYDKAFWAYKWVIDNVHYDKTITNFSAYDGLQSTGTVCSGYASLYCAILNELGVKCSFVGGTVGIDKISNHAWNIVKLNGKWYCVDPTGGDNNFEKFLLKSKETFSTVECASHNSIVYDNYEKAGEIFADTDYDNTVQSEIHPVLPSVYNIKMDILKVNILSKGEHYNFMINNPDNIPVYFKSSDKNIISINNAGVVKGKKVGTATITAYNTDLNFEQNCKITVK